MEQIEHLRDDRNFTNIVLFNQDTILKSTLDLKKCNQCQLFAPSYIMSANSCESLIQEYPKEKKGSPLSIFMDMILKLKHDSGYLTRLWNDHNMIREEELEKKEQAEGNLEIKFSLRSMQELIKKHRLETKVDVERFKQSVGGGSDNETFLEKLHLKLKTQVRKQVTDRIRYASLMKYIFKCIRFYIMAEIRTAIDNINASLSVSTEINEGKKKRHDFECLRYNIQLGFANWPEVEAFYKEGKFVKRLRQSIYDQGVSQLIFQDLTKNEKAMISTKMFIDNAKVRKLIDVKRFNEAM